MLTKSNNKKHLSGKVLVLGSDTRSFLAIIRSLGRENIEVHAAWHDSDSIALHSRYIKKVHRIPSYSPEKDRWKNALISLLKTENYDLVIPSNDQTIIPLQLNKLELQSHGNIYLLDQAAFEVTNNKFKTYNLAKELGIPVPKQVIVSNIGEAEDLGRLFGFPIVLKPHNSYTKNNLKEKQLVRKAYDIDQLKKYLQELLLHGNVITQENFLGVGIGIEVLACKGKILYAFQHARIHEPLMGGGSSYRKSEPLNPVLVDATERLIRAMDYTGVAMVEFKLNQETGKWVLLEINGRFWGSLPLAVSAGANFPFFLFQMLVEGQQVFPQAYQYGIFCRNWVKDLAWFRQNLRADRKDPTLMTLPLYKIATEIKNILFLKERSDTLTLDDPGPGILELKIYVLDSFLSLFKKITIALLSLSPVRKYFRIKAESKLETARNILFVCKGNICRSPFAQKYAETFAPPGVKITSAGYYPQSGRFSPREAIEAAQHFGVDLTEHRSVLLSESMLREADMVLIFDQHQYFTLRKNFPFIRPMLYFLSFFEENASFLIDDPNSKNIHYFLFTYGKIKDILDTIAKKWQVSAPETMNKGFTKGVVEK